MVGCAVAAVVLFWTSAYVQPPGEDPNAPMPAEERAAGRSLAGMMILFGALSVLLTVLCAGWLVYRYYQSIPTWKRQTKYPRRKR